MENWVFDMEYFEDWNEDYSDILETLNKEYEIIKTEEE